MLDYYSPLLAGSRSRTRQDDWVGLKGKDTLESTRQTTAGFQTARYETAASFVFALLVCFSLSDPLTIPAQSPGSLTAVAPDLFGSL
jgi:hypothetical protein